MKIYADTSVFGGMFDPEFDQPTKRFFAEIDAGRYRLVTSAIVAAEIEPAPKEVQKLFDRYAATAEIVEIGSDAIQLQTRYIDSGVVTRKSEEDALHVAVATVARCDLIVSWNFKHIVHFDKIRQYNAINQFNGYGQIGIYSPLEVRSYEST